MGLLLDIRRDPESGGSLIRFLLRLIFCCL